MKKNELLQVDYKRLKDIYNQREFDINTAKQNAQRQADRLNKIIVVIRVVEIVTPNLKE